MSSAVWKHFPPAAIRASVPVPLIRFIDRTDGFEDLLGDIGAHEQFWGFIPGGDPAADVAFEGVHAAVVAALEELT
jgi:hypothetical protein